MEFTLDILLIRDILDQERARAGDEIRNLGVLRANSVELRKLGEGERVTRNVRCPFLNEGRCTIYAARPQSCRNYHATNMAGCQQSYEEPENLDIDPDFAPGVYQAGGAHVEAVRNAMDDAGYDVSVYELNCALDAALSELGARERFESRLKPFTGLSGEEVPAEFDDLES